MTTIDDCPTQRSAIAEFSSYALGEPDLDSLLAEAVRLAATSLRTPLARVMQYRDIEDDLVLRCGYGWPDKFIGRAKVPADLTTPSGRAFLTCTPVVVRDVLDEHGFNLPPLYGEQGIAASVCVPIQGSDGPFGTLAVDATERRQFTDDHIAFLTSFANVIAEAVARLRRKRALRRAFKEKERLAQERGTLLRELQHRVRNHLQQIQALVNLHARRTQDDAARRGFADVAREVMALAALYDHLLGVGMERQVDLGAYVETLCRRLADMYGRDIEGREVNLTCRTVSVPVDVDRASLIGIIINELAANAFEHAFPERRGSIEVTVDDDDPGYVTVRVRDTGAGMAPGASKGIGLGLADRLVDQLGGTLEAIGGAGTTWILRLPT